MPRVVFRISLWLVALSLSCSDKPKEAPTAPVVTSAVEQKTPLKIAFAYVGPVGDAGWSYAHDMGRKAVEAEFGVQVVTSFVESVPESADAERVLREMVRQGNTLIFGTTFGYMEPMRKVAADSPQVKLSTPRATRPRATCVRTTHARTKGRSSRARSRAR